MRGRAGPGGARRKRPTIVALAGNANVGKSVIFNQLTGLTQPVGNWPGTTEARKVGTFSHEGRRVRVADLPGIYSQSTFSPEEEVTRTYISVKRPDVIVNVVDATSLERNFYFTLQLLELDAPVVVALNQMDLVEKKGITIDVAGLSDALGVPVVPVTAIKGRGVHEMVHVALEVADRCSDTACAERLPGKLKFPGLLERRIARLTSSIEKSGPVQGDPALAAYPPRYLAIRCLEGDEGLGAEVPKADQALTKVIRRLRHRIEEERDSDPSTVFSQERYAIAHRLWEEHTDMGRPRPPSRGEHLAELTTHPVWGYLILVGVILGMFIGIMVFGAWLSGLLEDLLFGLAPEDPEGFEALIWNGAFFGLVAGVSVALPYLVPFFLFMAVMEDSGYLARVAFLMDSTMHHVGLHGKAIIPLILGYGCSVPAILGTRIMESRRERLIAAVAATLVPCSARTVVIMGLVAAFVGFQWALLLYVFNLLFILVLGRLAYRYLPGEGTGLIMEMPVYRRPSLQLVMSQSWERLKEFVVLAIPLIVVGSVILEGLRIWGLLEPLGDIFSPVTVTLLGLPVVTGVVLLFGILRKEMTLVMLAAMEKTTNFSKIMTPVQMMTFTLVIMFYIPCLAAIAALVKEFGLTRATLISVGEIVVAIIIGAIAARILPYVMT